MIWSTILGSTWLKGAALAVIVGGVLWALVLAYGNSKFNEGKAVADAEWGEVLREAQEQATRAKDELARERALREAQSAQLARERQLRFQETQEEITNAETLDAAYSVYAGYVGSVRNDSADSLARARADYLSSIAAE